MAGKKSSGFEDLMEIAARLPWWVAVVLAIASFLVLHRIATTQTAQVTQMDQVGLMLGQEFGRTLAIVGQYVLPMLFLGGALVSGISSRRRGASNAPKKRTWFSKKPALVIGQDRIEPSIEAPPQSPDAPIVIPEQVHVAPSKAPTTWSLELLSSIEWKRFEGLCAEYYRAKGIRCETTALGADEGIDLKLFQDDSGQPTAIVQCKARGQPMMGVKPVRDLRGVMAGKHIEKGIFMTSGAFSDDARTFARENDITLIDAKLFLMMITRLPQDAQRRLLEFATKGDYSTPTVRLAQSRR